jgi:peroxiredoxin family protein
MQAVKGPAAATADERIAALEQRVAELEARQPEDRVALVVFSGDLDRALAAFIIATGAAALGQQVSMFFTFWGLGVLRERKTLADKGLYQKMLALMSPARSVQLPLSRMNYFGVGAKMMRAIMKEKRVASLEDLIALTREMGVRLVVCEMSRDLMEIRDEELGDGFESGGVATFLGDALTARAALFI